jgi:hypothetical protein
MIFSIELASDTDALDAETLDVEPSDAEPLGSDAEPLGLDVELLGVERLAAGLLEEELFEVDPLARTHIVSGGTANGLIFSLKIFASR